MIRLQLSSEWGSPQLSELVFKLPYTVIYFSYDGNPFEVPFHYQVCQMRLLHLDCPQLLEPLLLARASSQATLAFSLVWLVWLAWLGWLAG